MSQVERIARNGLIMEGPAGENGELLSLRDHEAEAGGGGGAAVGYDDGGVGYGVESGGLERKNNRRRSGSIRHSDNCCDKFLKCMGNVPCPSLLSWIVLLVGIGCFTGGLLYATWKTRDLLDADSLLWFMEYTIIGVVVGMFVILTLVLVTGHLSSEPTSRHVFNSLSKNKCARALNIVVLVLCYFLAACWVLVTAILATPLVFLANIFIVDADSFNPNQFGFRDHNYTGNALDDFRDKSKTLLICYGIAFLGAFFIVNSLIFFIMCISANITHLRDNKFAALNAYGAEEVHNSKHSVVDTNM